MSEPLCYGCNTTAEIEGDVIHRLGCNPILGDRISALTKELKEANEIKESQYQAFQEWKKDYFIGRAALTKEVSLLKDAEIKWGNDTLDKTIQIEFLKKLGDKMAGALESREHCLACQTHEHPLSKEALKEWEAAK